MNTDFNLKFRGDYISVRHGAGCEITLENTARLWSLLAVGCNSYSCRRVLIEGKPVWRKSDWLAAYNCATEATNIIQGLRVAYCFENYSEDDLTNFFKTVASNRGVEIEFFTDRQAALRWLGVDNCKSA